MFTAHTHIMLYVDDVTQEKEFWKNIGFLIENEESIMDYPTFDMRPSSDSTLTFTVYAKEFIQKVSPEVLRMVPSVLFESDDIVALHDAVARVTDTVSDIYKEPFSNFNFANPTGIHFAVKQAE